MSSQRAVSGLSALAMIIVSAAAPAASLGPPPAHAGGVAGIQGAGASTMLVQNRDPDQAATVVVDLYNQKGDPPVTLVRPVVPAGAAASVALSEESSVKNGAYAAVASSDRPIATLVRTQWHMTGGTAMSNDSPPGTDIIVPFAAKGHEGQTSLISIQNTDMNMPAAITVELYAAGQAVPLVTAAKNIGPGTSISIDLGKDPKFATVPSGTAGYARIHALVPIAVHSYVDIESSAMGVFAFEGIPMERAAPKLFAPLVQAGSPLYPGAAGDRVDSVIAVVNPGDAPVDVTIHYMGVAGACQAQAFNHPTFSLAGKTGAVVTQAPGQTLPGTGASPLPAGCAAAASLEATGGSIAAAVVARQATGTLAAAYTALAPSQGDAMAFLPHVRRRHTAWGASTAIQVMNLGEQAAAVSIRFRDDQNQLVENCTGCAVTLPAGGGTLWWPGAIPELADGLAGTATVSADQPVGVVVIEVAEAGGMDMSGYVGIGRGPSAGPPDAAPHRAYAPINLTTTIRATPTPPATATATPTAIEPEPTASATETATGPGPTTPATETATGPGTTEPATAPPSATVTPTAIPDPVTDTPPAPGSASKAFLPSLYNRPR